VAASVVVISEPVLLLGHWNGIHDEEIAMKTTILLAETLIAALLAVPMFAQVTPRDEKVQCRNYKDVLALFDRLGYTKKAWQAGIREIPRVYLADVPDTWRERSAKELSVADKKRLFFRLIAPIVLRINELILEDRVRAKELTERTRPGPERDTGRSSLADRTRGEVQSARIDERAARRRRLR